MNNTKIRLMGLWENETKNGLTYMSGRLGTARLLVFPNGYRRDDKDPSHIVYVVPNETEKQRQPQQSGQPQNHDPDDNVPF